MSETYVFSIYRSTSAVIHSKRSEDIPTFSGFAEGRFLVSLAETRPDPLIKTARIAGQE